MARACGSPSQRHTPPNVEATAARTQERYAAALHCRRALLLDGSSKHLDSASDAIQSPASQLAHRPASLENTDELFDRAPQSVEPSVLQCRTGCTWRLTALSHCSVGHVVRPLFDTTSVAWARASPFLVSAAQLPITLRVCKCSMRARKPTTAVSGLCACRQAVVRPHWPVVSRSRVASQT